MNFSYLNNQVYPGHHVPLKPKVSVCLITYAHENYLDTCLQNILNQELRVGSRYPESRTGNIDASIVTGQGVQALMGAFDTQVKSAQAIFAASLRDIITICFQVLCINILIKMLNSIIIKMKQRVIL